ncbi:peptide deformylase, partial [Dysosmobacter welbionis]
RHAVLAGEAGHVAGLHIGQRRGSGNHVGSAGQGHPAGLGIRPGAAHGAGIAGHQGGTARQRGVDEVLADAAEQLLDHHDGEEVAHQDHPVGHVHRAHERQQDAGNRGGEIVHGLGLLHELAIAPLKEHAAHHGHGSQSQGPEAELHNGPDQGGHHGDDNIQHDGAGVLRRPDVGRRS